jgi:hypothetical protein
MSERESENRRLRDLLRRGDPAADGREPDPAELARMRAAILAEPEAPRRTPLLVPLAAAAALAGALVAGWLLSRPAPSPRTAGPPIAAGGAEHAPQAPARSVVGAELPPEPTPPRGAAPPTSASAPPPVAVAPAANPAAASDPGRKRSARQVQLRGPGGTKILWKLNPEFDL